MRAFPRQWGTGSPIRNRWLVGDADSLSGGAQVERRVGEASPILVIIWYLLSQATTRFRDLGYHTSRINTERKLRTPTHRPRLSRNRPTRRVTNPHQQPGSPPITPPGPVPHSTHQDYFPVRVTKVVFRPAVRLEVAEQAQVAVIPGPGGRSGMLVPVIARMSSRVASSGSSLPIWVAAPSMILCSMARPLA